MRRSVFPLLIALACAAFTAQVARSETSSSPPSKSLSSATGLDPVGRWEFDYESGIIWKMGEGATPLTYVVLPQILTWKTPPVFRTSLWGGDLVMRSRFSVLLEPIIRGPEHYYFGTAASGSLEWWNAHRTFSGFFASGGGIGVMHSRGHEIAGAQGQDLNFNWLAYLGARVRLSPGMSATLGLYFQHVSNTGLDKINPGLNALGPLLGVTWHF